MKGLRNTIPAEPVNFLQRLGRNIRTARLRRKLRIEDVAERIGISRFTVAAMEQGNPTTSAITYFSALWALGLLAQAEELADPDRDEEGKALESARHPKQAPRRRTLDNDF